MIRLGRRSCGAETLGISWEGDMAEGSPIIETTMMLGGAALFGLVTAVQQ
jgi:hypothetical protein